MRPAKACAFCGNDAVEMTGEHIWSAWIGRLFEDSGKVSGYDWRYRNAQTGVVKSWPAKGLDHKLRVVCDPCNSGWMSRLETRAKMLLSGAIRAGDAVRCQEKDLHLLAAWTFKSAVVADHAHLHGHPFFSPRERSEFGLTLALPPGIKIWIATFRGIHVYSGRFDCQVVEPCAPGPLRDIEFYAFTYVAGHLVLQLLSPRWKDPLRRNRFAPSLRPDSAWETAVTQFWPTAGSVLSWPISPHLSDDSIDLFMNRFAVPISVPIA